MGYLRFVVAILVLFLAWVRRTSNRSIGHIQTQHYQATRQTQPQAVKANIVNLSPCTAPPRLFHENVFLQYEHQQQDRRGR